jgi:hypothetical protein
MSDDRGDLGEVVVMEVDTANAKAIAQVLHVLVDAIGGVDLVEALEQGPIAERAGLRARRL